MLPGLIDQRTAAIKELENELQNNAPDATAFDALADFVSCAVQAEQLIASERDDSVTYEGLAAIRRTASAD